MITANLSQHLNFSRSVRACNVTKNFSFAPLSNTITFLTLLISLTKLLHQRPHIIHQFITKWWTQQLFNVNSLFSVLISYMLNSSLITISWKCTVVCNFFSALQKYSTPSKVIRLIWITNEMYTDSSSQYFSCNSICSYSKFSKAKFIT